MPLKPLAGRRMVTRSYTTRYDTSTTDARYAATPLHDTGKNERYIEHKNSHKNESTQQHSITRISTNNTAFHPVVWHFSNRRTMSVRASIPR